MSPHDARDPKADRKAGTKQETVDDLNASTVTDKDSKQVKGGLNPQPLPPKIKKPPI